MKKYYDILNESFDKYGIKDSFIEDELEPVDDISDWFLSPTEDSDDILLDEPELIYSDSDEDFDADDDISTSKRFAAMFGYEYNDEDIDDDLAEKISDEDKVDSDALRAIYRKSPSKLNKTDKELLDKYGLEYTEDESLTEAFDPIKEAVYHFRNDLGRDPEDIDEVINYMINMGDIEEPELDYEDKKSIEAYNSWYDELADKISDALQESLNEDVDSKKMVEIDWI